MRKRFEQQIQIGQLLIEDTEISKKCRHSLVELMAALKVIFTNAEYNEKVFSILDEALCKNKQKTGRNGMSLWQLFVLSQVRLCSNASYDEVHYISNHDKLVRQIMGVERESWCEQINFEYQNIYDNLTLLNESTIKELNDVIVAFGHEVFKKKEQAALHLKTDSFVVESNVHFPTDYNLLWDCARKTLDGISKYVEKYDQIKGWRKIKDWRYQIKSLMRELGRASASGGKNKEIRLQKAAGDYIEKANLLVYKVENEIFEFPIEDNQDIAFRESILHYLGLMKKHINLVNRRIIKGEQIPHAEKMFSIFETYTEMIKKGKTHPNVEFGKKLAITTDQFHLIIEYQLMENEQDRDIVKELKNRISKQFGIFSWSFDKGFWLKENKESLQEIVPEVIMPKLGKRNQEEEQEETSKKYKRLKNKHSAIESNINELENRGLNRCPDKGYKNFKRYVGLAILAYNIKKIGRELLRLERERLEIQVNKAA